jgi:uncharacterized OsmC-like protein
MEISKLIYLGNLRVKATHLKSGEEIITDAPLDNHGKGEAFSPTDLMSTSLANCAITLMGIAANTHNIELINVEATVSKFMTSNPRRVGKILVEIDAMIKPDTEKNRTILIKAAETCPVSLSISEATEKVFVFNFED